MLKYCSKWRWKMIKGECKWELKYTHNELGILGGYACFFLRFRWRPASRYHITHCCRMSLLSSQFVRLNVVGGCDLINTFTWTGCKCQQKRYRLFIKLKLNLKHCLQGHNQQYAATIWQTTNWTCSQCRVAELWAISCANSRMVKLHEDVHSPGA